MPSALELISNPSIGIDPITESTTVPHTYDSDELAVLRLKKDDIESLALKIYAKGKKRTVRQELRPHVLDAVIEESLDKTPTISITVHDPDWDLLNSGALAENIDINPGNIPRRWYRLDTYRVDDDDITLTFATRNAVFLSSHKRPYKISRNKVTRAQFILTMLRKVKIVQIPMHCPELKKKQKIAKYSSDSERKRARNRDPGFTSSDKITVKGAIATATQKRVIEQVVERGVDMGVPGLVVVCGVMTVIQETEAGRNRSPGGTGGNTATNVFEQDASWGPNGDPYHDAGAFFKECNRIFNQNPNVGLGDLAAKTQRPADPRAYAQSADRWRAEAQHAVNAFGGIDVNDPGSSTTSTEFRAAYEFMVGEPDGPYKENYLGATYRLAEQVNWRAFWVRDTLHYQSDEELYRAKARVRLRRNVNGVEHVNFEADRSQKVARMILQVRMDNWVAPCGTVVIWDEGGEDVRGRWLISNIRRSVFNQLGEIILTKPMREKLEPASQLKTKTDPSQMPAATGGSYGNVPDVDSLAYPLEVKGTNLGGKAAHLGRAWGDWQSDFAIDIGVPRGTAVYAVADATITKLGGSWSGGSGNPDGYNVTIKTGNNEFFYTHLQKREPLTVGQKVEKGAVLGESGAANGVDHLHFACRQGDPEVLTGWKGAGGTP